MSLENLFPLSYFRRMRLVFMLLLFLPVTSSYLKSQDSLYARYLIGKLCAPEMQGRGYYKGGAVKAATFIAGEMKKKGLGTLKGDYFQTYSFPVNVFKSDPFLALNGLKMNPGKDFVVNADAPISDMDASGGEIIVVNEQNIGNFEFKNKCKTANALHFSSKKNTGKIAFYIIDTLPEKIKSANADFIKELLQNSNTITIEKTKLTWSAAPEQSRVVSISLLNSSAVRNWITDVKNVKWKIRSKIINTTQKNVIGFIRGTAQPDSFFVITAHYDHLGRMGPKSLFPGANDNAAGIAMLLDLAGYYQKNPPKYSMVFIAFSGEEAGLIGSGVYAKNPRNDLNKTRFLLNLDLVGTGETGITVVNGSVFKKEFELLDGINKNKHYLTKIQTRGKAANSDHYHFTQLGVPSFFWYQGGPRSAYHDVDDIPETLTLFGYNNTIRLTIDFLKALGN